MVYDPNVPPMMKNLLRNVYTKRVYNLNLPINHNEMYQGKMVADPNSLPNRKD